MTSSNGKVSVILSGEEIQALLDAAEFADDAHEEDCGFSQVITKACVAVREQTGLKPEYYGRGDLRD